MTFHHIPSPISNTTEQIMKKPISLVQTVPKVSQGL